MNNTSDFYKWFETIASKLGNREMSFRKIFKYLDSQPDPIIIVETGCLRLKDNFLDGQSTLFFDKYALSRNHSEATTNRNNFQTQMSVIENLGFTKALWDAIKFGSEEISG